MSAPAPGPGGSSAVPGPDAPPVRGFLFDPNQCTGCSACALACSTENELGWGVSWRQVVPFNAERRAGVPSFHLSLACNHCTDAPCVTHCPTGAMARDPKTGAVVVNADTCIGCRYCAWVCPYDAPRFDEDRGVMTKCTLCNHKLATGGLPACAEACPTGALDFGPLPLGSAEGPARLPGFPGKKWEPRIAFTPLRRNARPPESTWSVPPEVAAAFGGGEAGASTQGTDTTPGSGATGGPGTGGHAQPTSTRLPRPSSPAARRLSRPHLSLLGEVPLWVFTTGMAGLVGWVGAAVLGGAPLPLGAFVASAAILLAVSTVHLGRPLRAWRALANVRTSALSREIAYVNGFFALGTLWLAWGGAGGAPWLPGAPTGTPLIGLGLAATLVGIFALGQIDHVYEPVRGKGRIHSAQALLTGPMVAAALMAAPMAYMPFAFLKLFLYARRKRWTTSLGAMDAALRVGGLVGPPALWALAPGAGIGWTALLLVMGESLDRADFYRELAIEGPREQAIRDAAGWSAG